MHASGTPTPDPALPPLARFHQLDGLRALACLLVVAAHALTGSVVAALQACGARYLAVELSHLPQSGVELFFVLSGVVVLRPYVRGLRRFDPVVYARRRVERLWPPYLTVLLLSVPLLVVAQHLPTWYSREILPEFRLGDLAGQLLILNFSSVSYSGAWWSLQVEVLFYLLAPLAVYALNRRVGWPAIAAAALCVGAASLAAGTITNAEPFHRPLLGTGLFFLLYSPCFFLGTVLARLDLGGRRGANLLLASGLIGILATPWVPWVPFPLSYGLFYAGLLTLSLQRGHFLGRLLTHPLLVWLGERSYSLFLVHFTSFYATNYVVSYFCAERSLAYGLATRLIGIPLALLAAMVLFHFVERPFARGLVTAQSFWPFRFVRRALPAGQENAHCEHCVGINKVTSC